MPADAGNPRSESPAALDDKSSKRDKKYRQYATNVERALSLFDSTLREWADYISFLGRLLKALQTRPLGVGEIPNTALVAKRLAQCLDPRLGSGVHQKALEVYAFSFSILEKEGLERDLPLYLPGLSPTLSFASLSVKPALLSLFENHILILDAQVLKPALKAITLALLPGLEDQTSEEFERTNTLLNKFRGAVRKNTLHDGDEETSRTAIGDRYFWHSIFLSTMTSSSRRQGALNYLTRHLPRLDTQPEAIQDAIRSDSAKHRGAEFQYSPEIEAVISPEPGLLVRCFAAALRDDQLLVQRGFLDLLVTHLPLSSQVLQSRVKSEDLELLISAASSVVARREMSLNRRLWNWFIGPEMSKDPGDNVPTSPKPSQSSTLPVSRARSGNTYFERYGLESLTESVRKMIASKSVAPSTRARPFRICLSLMDRSEIGGLIVPQIFIPAMESMRQYETIATSKEAFTEVFRSAQVFFDGIQSRLIWSQITQLVYGALEVDRFENSIPTIEAQRKLDLVWFIISKFNVREEEMLVIYMPMVCLLILISVEAIQQKKGVSQPGKVKDLLAVALKIANRLLELIPERAFTDEEDESPDQTASSPDASQARDNIVRRILQAYDESTENMQLTFAGGGFASMLVRCGSNLLILALQSAERRQNVEANLSLLATAIEKSPNDAILDTESIISQLLEHTALHVDKLDFSHVFSTTASMLAVYEFLHAMIPSTVWMSEPRIRKIATNFILHLWTYFSPSRPQHSVEAVRCIWRLHSISPSAQLVESTVASLMLSETISVRGEDVTVEGSRRFATLWSQSGSRLQSSSERRPNSGRGKKKPGKKSLDDFSDPEMLARPLLLLLDSLSDQSSAVYDFTVSWLQSLASVQIIMEFLTHRLYNAQHLKDIRSRKDSSDNSEASDSQYSAGNISESAYWLRLISNLIQCCSATAWTSLNVPILALEQSSEPRKEDAISPTPHERTSQEESTTTVQLYLLQTCIFILEDYTAFRETETHTDRSTSLRRIAVQLTQQLLRGSSLIAINFPDLENSLIRILSASIEASDLSLQRPLMETLLIILRGRKVVEDLPSSPRQRNFSQVSLTIDKGEQEITTTESFVSSQLFLDCLIKGLSSDKNRQILDHWVKFLNESILTNDGNAFQSLLPLVGCFSRSIDEVFEALKSIYENPAAASLGNIEPINTLNILFNGLEQTLARGHDQLMREEAAAPVPKTPEQAQGFFGNMVSGVFASEGQKPRPATANDRLTVLICFKDTVKIAYRIWSWGDAGSARHLQNTASSASFNYSSIRLRNRTRRLLEHLFTAEPLECLETIVEMWQNSDEERSSTIFNLLHALEASRPKNTMPVTFNAIYSRTNQSALDPRRSSTLTSELSDIDLAAFLVAYTRSIDDDALDEIWADCMAFARDVLGNPMPQRQILPRLLEFVAILGKKIDNTNFGEQRRMRKEIGDLFVRLLSATFTIKPLSFTLDATTPAPSEKNNTSSVPNGHVQQENLEDVVAIMASVLPGITPLLVDTDRMAAAATTVSTQIFGPTFRWRTFPHNVTSNTTEILQVLSKQPEISKIWKKDISDAFNDSRFFCASTLALAKDGWMPILRQWSLVDKEKMPELLARLIPPTTAGIVFGVGAASARIEADRKAQLNLRRISLLLLSNPTDDFVTTLPHILEKLTELLSATPASSPSSTTRAELFMLMRALILKITPVHLSSLWPILNTELYSAIASLGATKDPTQPPASLNVPSLLQAAKLLDTLLTISPDDFQLREWLYVTDTIDAVYRPAHWRPVALVDSLADRIDATTPPTSTTTTSVSMPFRKPSVVDTVPGGTENAASSPQQQQQHDEEGVRKPLLRWENMRGMPRDETLVERVLRPYLRELSIMAFESTYLMERADGGACVDDLLWDLCDEGTVA